mgnify:CR=1 FL=1
MTTERATSPTVPPDNAEASDLSQEEASALREAHRHHERSLNQFGALQLAGGVLSGAWGLFEFAAASQVPDDAVIATVRGILFVTLGGLSVWSGSLLRALKPKARGPATAMAVVGLLAFPIGTLVNGYLLYLIHSKKGRVVLSTSYQNVVRRTTTRPEKSSKIILFAFGLLVVALLAAVIAAVLS